MIVVMLLMALLGGTPRLAADRPVSQTQAWIAQMHMPHVSGPFKIESTQDLCPGDLGCTTYPPSRPYVIAAQDRYSFYHELGHLYDWVHLRASDRRYAARAMGYAGMAWDESNDPHGGAQDAFADTYADCAIRYTRHWRPDWSPSVMNPAKLPAFCRWIASKRY